MLESGMLHVQVSMVGEDDGNGDEYLEGKERLAA
jgi:hypothetical protein